LKFQQFHYFRLEWLMDLQGRDRQFEEFEPPHHPASGFTFSERGSAFAIALLVSLGYYVGSQIGFFLTPRTEPFATYWPANAILMAALLLIPLRRWWALIIGVLGAHLLVQLPKGIPLTTSLGWFASNTGEALLGAALLYRFRKREPLFESVRGLFYFLSIGVFLAPFLTSFFDAAVVVITQRGQYYWILWLTRFLSNGLAAMTIVPVIVTGGNGGFAWMRKLTLPRMLELVVLALLIIPITILVYGGVNPSPELVPALVYVPLPFLLWACLRFGVGGLAACGTTIALISFHYVIEGRGPFASATLKENIFFLQLLLGIVIIPLMLVNAVLLERRRTEQKLQQSRIRLIETQEQERRRIARELHDDIGQQLSLIKLELHQISEAGAEHIPGSLKMPLRSAMRQIDSVSEAIRTVSHGLHPAHLDFLGLLPALKAFCSELRQQTDMNIYLHEGDLPRQLDHEVALCFFRVAQEALNNVIKHSRARNVDVHLKTEGADLLLRIMDDGIGFGSDNHHSAGLGVVNMKDRVESLGGTLQITSERKRGTILAARAPASRPQLWPGVDGPEHTVEKFRQTGTGG